MPFNANRDLAIAGPLAEDQFVIERIAGHEVLGAPFEYEITLLNMSLQTDLSPYIGDTMAVSLELEDDEKRFFHGHVTRMALIDTFDRHARYRVSLRPWFFVMSPRTNSRIFQHLSVPDIAAKLFREHGFSDFQLDLSGSYPAREYVVQYQESDFHFISRLLENAGIYYYFKHEKNRHLMVLSDSEMSHGTAPGYDEVVFYPPSPNAARDRDHLSTWEMVQELRTGAYVADDFDFERPASSLLTKLKAAGSHKRGDQEHYQYPGGFTAHGEGESQVRARLEGLRRDTETVTGQGDARGLGAGVLFSLAGHPIASQNKKYLVTAARFEARTNPHDAGEAGDDAGFRIAISAVDSRVPFRPLLSTRIPRVEGPQTAIVVGQGGEEIWTDKYGRVKVQFHWDREGERQ